VPGGRGCDWPVTVVYLEAGKRRVFACAPAWPGWCRAGRGEEAALAALAAAAPRYAAVCAQAGIPFDPAAAAASFEVAETVTGSATTDIRRARRPSHPRRRTGTGAGGGADQVELA